ncbi:MAG: hypothetical protein KF699_05590 [Phycisphaeraceae bacterium]|nr:hypothetical protein [Phycisphaeraceae bacterium]
MRRNKIIVVASGVLVVAGTTVPLAHAGSLSPANIVAMQGQQIPGQPAGVTYGALTNNPSISADGYVVWGGAINGVPAVNGLGAFSGTSAATVQMVAQSGMQAPGGPAGATMDLNGASNGFQVGTVKVNSAGIVSYVSLMTGGGVTTGVNNWGVFSGTTGGAFGMLARSGSQVPGAAAGTITNNQFSTSTAGTPVNGSNLLYYGIGITGGDAISGVNNSVILGSDNGTLFQVARQGAAAPGTDGNLGSMSSPTMFANSGGMLLFNNTLSGGTVTSANDSATYLYEPGGGLQLVHREGNIAPGTLGATFSGGPSMFSANFNNQGQFLFTTNLAGGDVDGTTNNQAVYVGSGSGAALAWRKGSDAPGVAGGVFTATNSIGMNLANSGKVALPATMAQGGAISAANDTGVWWGAPGALELLVREGDAVPTLNAAFGALGNVTPFINAIDQVVFTCAMTSEDSVLNGKTALMAFDPVQGLFPIAYTSEMLEVAPGDFRTISSFNLRGGNADGGLLTFSDTGLLALRVGFTDGTNAIVTYAVPAPGAIALAPIAVAGLRRRRR